MPESKNTNDTTDEAVAPVDETADGTDEVVEEEVDVLEGADTSGASDPSVTPQPDEPESELVDVPDELKETDEDSDDDTDEDSADDATEDAETVPAAVAAGTAVEKDKKDKATKVADDSKPGKKPGKAVKPPQVKKAEKKAKKTGPPPRKAPKQRRWIAPLMLACWLIGLAWLVVFYVAGNNIPYMKDLHNWNLLVGMALIALGFVVSTQWV